MKRVFGTIEIVFDISYLVVGSIIGFVLLFSGESSLARLLAGRMALVLIIGDAFHLVPRMLVIQRGKEELLRKYLGLGKQVTSVTMAVFYLFLWQIGLHVFTLENAQIFSYVVYFLVAIRIVLCLLPQNKWAERYPPIRWGIIRNIPFFIQGMMVAALYFLQRGTYPGLSWMWLAIILSFLFYLPVVLWVNKNPKIGMLMLPKTCFYIWILVMCLSL